MRPLIKKVAMSIPPIKRIVAQRQGYTKNETLFDASLFGAGLMFFVEQRVKLFQDDRFPSGHYLRAEFVLSANLRLVRDAGQQIEYRLSFELRGKRTSGPWHRNVSLGRPVLTSILAQRQGRTTTLSLLRVTPVPSFHQINTN